MPYARFMQEKRLADEYQRAKTRDTYRQNAFIGWQISSAMGGNVGSFEKYLKKLGLSNKPKLTRSQLEAEKRKAFAALDLVQQRFDGGTP